LRRTFFALAGSVVEWASSSLLLSFKWLANERVSGEVDDEEEALDDRVLDKAA